MRGFRPNQEPYGSRGLEGLRAMIPKIEAMGFKQAQPADPVAGLKAMIPQMEAMGYKQNPQYFADGGFVQGIKRAFGMDEERNAQIAAYRARAAAEKAQQQSQAQQQTPQPQQRAVTQYSGMSATQRREKELGLADGGLVRGLADAVRPFSESVGGYWSNSNKEFEATNPGVGGRIVRAVNPVTGLGAAVGAMYDAAGNGSARDAGIAAFQAAPMFAAMKVVPAAKSLLPTAPKVVVAAGKTASKAAGDVGAGVVADEAQARGFADGGRVRPRGFVVGPGTETSDSIPARLSNREYVLPADTVRAVGVEALDALREATHKPVKGEQSKAARGFFAGGTPGGVGAWFQDQQREQEQRKQEALAAGEAAASAAASVPEAKPAPSLGAPMPGTKGADLVAAELAKPQQRAATGMAIKDALQAPFGKGSSPATPMLTAPATPAATTQNATDVRLAAGTMGSPTTIAGALNQPKPEAPGVANPTEAQAREVVPGVYNHGRGQYSDDPSGMNMPKGFTGQPSAANNAILERMSDQSKAESMARLGFGPQAQYAAEVQRAKNINADEAARNNSVGARIQRLSDPFSIEGRAMRNLQMDIDSSVDRKGRPTGETQALLEKQKAMVGGYIAEPAQQATIAGQLQREGVQQAGETQREGIRAGLEQQKIAQAGDELGMKREAQGFQTRAAKRLEDAQIAYDAAKTPEEKASIAQRMRDLQVKEAPSPYEFKVSPAIRNADGSTTEGSAWRFNRATGQAERVDGGAGGVKPLDKNDQALAIRDNPSLSREQKVAALKQLGY